MASTRIRQAWDRTRARDLTMLPSVERKERPGSFGTHAERTLGSAPEAPTLDSGPLYTGEYREEVNGNPIKVPPQVSEGTSPKPVVLATLRRPWPYVGFAVKVNGFPAGTLVTLGLNIIMRSGRAQLISNVFGGSPTGQLAFTIPAQPAPDWIAMNGIYAGARVELWATQDAEGTLPMTGNLWGYNAPGFGP